jgi:LysM repeat protein
VVAAGDTLTQIATRYGTTVGAIQQANGLRTDVINIGQVLLIP